MSAPRVVVTLVHGTFAADSDWVNVGSPLHSALSAKFPECRILPFHWSGRNSHRERVAAGTLLRDELLRRFEMFPEALHYLIAHSHGGNVCLYALRDSEVVARCSGLACISTPFLHVKAIETKWLDECFQALWGIMFGVPLFCLLGIRDRRFFTSLGEILSENIFYAAMFVASVAVLWIVRPGGWLAGRIDRLVLEVERGGRLPNLEGFNLCLISRTADEASGALAAGHFTSWLTRHTWMWLALRARWIELDVVPVMLASPGRVIAAMFCLSMTSVALGLWLFDGNPPMAFEVFAVAVVVLILMAPSLPAYAFCGVAIAPAWLAASIGMVTTGGLELAGVALRLDVSPEATPPGSWLLHLLPGNDTPRPEFMDSYQVLIDSRLSHSAYDDPRVCRLLCEWIESSGLYQQRLTP